MSALFDLEAISFRLEPTTDSKLCDPALLSVRTLWVLKDQFWFITTWVLFSMFWPTFLIV